MMQKFFLCFVLCMWCAVVLAQQTDHPSKKAYAFFWQARESFREGKIEKALHLLEKAKEADPVFSDIYLLQADICQKQGNEPEEIRCIEKAMEIDSLRRHPYYFYILADYYFEREAYEKAGTYYHLYLLKDSRQRAAERAKKQLKNCEFACEALRMQTKQPVELFWEGEDPVYWPTLDAAGNTLLYTAQHGHEEKIWMLKDSACYPLSFETTGNAGAPSLTADGQMMYFSMDGGRNGFDIYVSYRLADTLWSAPVNLGYPVNTSGWEAQPAVSADGTKMYFASTREGGQGGSDIWFTRLLRREKNGRQIWSEPRCLYFNTPGDEMAPFLYFDNRSLFFSSDGYPGMGKKDIYKVDVEKVTSPENIGITVNTAADELGFVVDASGKWGYFSSDHRGKKAIYRYHLEDHIACPPVTYLCLQTEDEYGNRLMPDQLIVVETIAGDTLAYYEGPYINGQMLACVPAGRLLSVCALKKGYLYYSDTLTVAQTIEGGERWYTIRLSEIRPDRNVILKGVFFDVDSYHLQEASYTALQQLLSFMRLNPDVKIEISGHTDNTGSDEHNYRLSENRAFEVYKYLFVNRISKERMTYKGYGKDCPLAPNDTDSGKAMNRRTEIRVKNE